MFGGGTLYLVLAANGEQSTQVHTVALSTSYSECLAHLVYVPTTAWTLHNCKVISKAIPGPS